MGKNCHQCNLHVTYQCQKCFDARREKLSDTLSKLHEFIKYVILATDNETGIHEALEIQFNFAKEQFALVSKEIADLKKNRELAIALAQNPPTDD